MMKAVNFWHHASRAQPLGKQREPEGLPPSSGEPRPPSSLALLPHCREKGDHEARLYDAPRIYYTNDDHRSQEFCKERVTAHVCQL